jgi:hypothetical protein
VPALIEAANTNRKNIAIILKNNLFTLRFPSR